MTNYELAENDYMSGMKYKDIAEKYGVSLATVKSWKTRYGWNRKGMHTKIEKSMHTKKDNIEHGKEPVADEVESVLQNTELTEKQRLFCIYLVKQRNKVKAYQRAYECSYENACSHASELWKKGEIQKYYYQLLEEYRAGIDIEIRDLFQWYLDIARADINDFVTLEGGFAQAKKDIDGTLVSEISETTNGIKVKLNDRMKAMDWLSEHIGIASEKQKAELELLQAQKEKLAGTDTDNNQERVIIVNDLEEFEEKDS